MKTRVKKQNSLPTLFQPPKAEMMQTVTVTVTVEQQDDGIAECIAGCFRCCVGTAKTAVKA